MVGRCASVLVSSFHPKTPVTAARFFCHRAAQRRGSFRATVLPSVLIPLSAEDANPRTKKKGRLLKPSFGPSVQIRYDVVRPQPLPPLGAAVEARASENSSTGPPQQLPPLLSSPRALESATCSSFGREQGGEGGKDTESPRPSPPYPGDGSAPGGRICSPSATDDARPNDTQRQRQLRGQAGPMHSTRPLLNREESDSAVASPGGGRCAAVAHQMHEGLGGGTTAML